MNIFVLCWCTPVCNVLSKAFYEDKKRAAPCLTMSSFDNRYSGAIQKIRFYFYREEFVASSSYTAEQALTGYLYQIRLALLYSLKFLQKRVHDDAIFYVGIENYDDISFENAQGGLERVIQTKYHAASSGTLTDSSVDLWRSIRIWISIFQEKKEALPLFYLLTTAKLLKNSATALLADEERAQANKIRSQDKEEKILAMLEKAANNSRNKETQDARTLFLNMPPDDRKKLFSRVVICPSSPIVFKSLTSTFSILSGTF